MQLFAFKTKSVLGHDRLEAVVLVLLNSERIETMVSTPNTIVGKYFLTCIVLECLLKLLIETFIYSTYLRLAFCLALRNVSYYELNIIYDIRNFNTHIFRIT